MLRFCIAALALLAGIASAKPLTVRVTDSAGKPVSNAVVTLRPAAGGRAARVTRTFSVSQKDLEFHPFVLVVPVGATVAFPNLDPTKHHVYSFSPAKRFELKLFAKDQSRSVKFDKAGVVALGCNIHDQMTAFVVVADSAWTAATDARGYVRFDDAPGVGANLSVWHPYLRAPNNSMSRQLGAGETSATFAVRLRPPPVHGMSGY